MNKTTDANNKSYDFFISYYSGTGYAFAKYLKDHAKDFGRSAFLDKEDIRKDIKEETDEWRSQIDQGIANSRNFILVMTLGFKDRPEIKRELRNAFSRGISVFSFKKDSLDDQDLIMETDEGTIDFSKREYTPFNDECDLLAKVEHRLRGKPIPQKKSSFMKEAAKLIATEGLEIKQINEPLLEIVVGPSDSSEEWLPIGNNNENEDLLNVSPYRIDNLFCIKARRKYYEFKSVRKDVPINFFLKVTPNGYFHLVEPLSPYESNYYLTSVFSQITHMLIYCAQMMKYQKVRNKQSILIILRKVRGLEIFISKLILPNRFMSYSFPNSDPEPFFGEFNPASNWKEMGLAMKKIFRELCQELSYTPNDEVINRRLTDILRYNFYVTHSHDFTGSRQHILFQAINISDFGFAEEKKK